MHHLLQVILRILSRAVIRKYNPLVIGITGSVGKTSTKDAVFVVLKSKYSTRRSIGSFNTEEGLPITILGDWNEKDLLPISKFGSPGKKFKKIFLWIKIILAGFLNLIFLPKSKYPEIIILEYGADRPGDIDKLVRIARPKIGVVTAVGELPVHVEFYSGPEEVAKEKLKLVQALPSDGFAILNHDDDIVFRMRDLSRAEAMTYGFNAGADVRASDFMYFIETGDKIAGGFSFKLNYGKNMVPFRLINALGRHQVYAVLAAAAIGLHLGMNLVEISQALEKMEFPKQRMKLIRGIKKSLIIDDSYNASPLSTHAALDTLKEFGGKVIAKTGAARLIAVLGDMRELGVFTERAHRLIGNLAGERAEYLFTIGPAAKFIADSAFNQLPKENIMSFNDADEAKEAIRAFIREGDIILVKGSRAMEMEKIVEVLAIP
ncbi:MAG: UDP-N-acetylmuramoyl-tripeptide--D-alanyl-D-alanine ligase [Patescibacteria group bacterium]